MSHCFFSFFFFKSVFKYKLIYFNWRLITLQYCVGSAIHQHRYTRVPHPEPPSLLPPRTIPLGHLSAPAPNIQYHASNLDWRFISSMILYMFQCHSPKSCHPLPLPQSPKDCSIHLCIVSLFCISRWQMMMSIIHVYSPSANFLWWEIFSGILLIFKFLCIEFL